MTKQVHRVIENVTTPGWYYRNPRHRMPWCSWCGTDTIDRNGATWCPKCDEPERVPPRK